MGGTAAMAGLGLSGLGDIFGAASQSGANNQNYNLALQHQQMVQQYVNGLMQPGMNPFGQAILNFVGQGLPGTVNGFNPGGYGFPGQGAPPGSSSGQPGQNYTGGTTDNPVSYNPQ